MSMGIKLHHQFMKVFLLNSNQFHKIIRKYTKSKAFKWAGAFFHKQKYKLGFLHMLQFMWTASLA